MRLIIGLRKIAIATDLVFVPGILAFERLSRLYFRPVADGTNYTARN